MTFFYSLVTIEKLDTVDFGVMPMLHTLYKNICQHNNNNINIQDIGKQGTRVTLTDDETSRHAWEVIMLLLTPVPVGVDCRGTLAGQHLYSYHSFRYH